MPFCTTESISRDPNLFAFVVDSNVIPISKLVADIIMHGFITAQKFVQRFVRKNDAKTKGVIGLVALEDLNIPIGLGLLAKQACKKPSGPAANDRHLHRSRSKLISILCALTHNMQLTTKI